MAVPADGVTRWFRDSNGKISQINNVVEITFASPLVANGTFRDSPPVVVGGAAVSDSAVSPASGISVAGGTTQTVTTGSPNYIVAPSSVVQDDNFTHVDLRFAYSPIPLVFFRTTDDLTASNPDTNTFPLERPASRTPAKDTFDTFNVDCVFSWGEDCGIMNSPPPGWAPGVSA